MKIEYIYYIIIINKKTNNKKNNINEFVIILKLIDSIALLHAPLHHRNHLKQIEI